MHKSDPKTLQLLYLEKLIAPWQRDDELFSSVSKN